MALFHVTGDVTKLQCPGPKIVMHCANDLGRWNSGVVASLAKKWPTSKAAYLAWYRQADEIPGTVTGSISLGAAQLVQVEEDVWVASIIGQHGVGISSGGRPPIRYDALRKGIITVARWATDRKATVHAPKLGSGSAAGSWPNIEKILRADMADIVDVYIYTLPTKP
jgi:O-acetyl-ADP-ribose deacetylase (regulator of RNase III)